MYMTNKIGFACKWIDHAGQVDGIKSTDDCKKYNTGTTTVAWLNRQSRSIAEDKLWSLMKQNIEATRRLVQRVGELDEHLRMVRISSDILPVYTHDNYKYFWHQADVKDYAARTFAEVGRIARDRNVRLSFHPGQFCVMASDNPDIVNRSIEEFEYHVDMARWMGFGRQFQDMKINVHISGRQGPNGIRAAYKKLTPEARNCLTIENEENSHGLDTCLQLADILPIVLDIHHHWIHSGEYIQPNDDRVARVIDSWRGNRPTCHYSVSRENVVVAHCPNTLPNFTQLLETGHKKQHLRAHSDFYWNNAVNQWALSFIDQFDIMCEAKAKNLASKKLYEQWAQK
jgi:UV DNA damage repair endonuclease